MKKVFNDQHDKLKALALSLGLAALTLTTNHLNAQDGGGVFGRGPTSESEGSLLRKGTNPNANVNHDGSDPTDITIHGIGQSEAPLGSGIAILIGAGLGYVALKKKEDRQ